MKPLLTLACSLLLCTLLFAQKDKDIPAFGKIDKSDLELKECDFDKNAEAVVLFDVGNLSCNFGAGSAYTQLERRVRIKILNDKGFEHASIHLPYRDFKNEESIKNLSAQTYNLDASGNIIVTKVEKKLVYDKRINKKVSEAIFTFPDLKAGSVIEYKYTLTGAGLGNWYFQKDIPVKLSRYIVDFPVDLEVAAHPFCSLPLDTKSSFRGQNKVQTYTMQNIPALRDEPYISSEDDYLQRIQSDIIAVTIGGIRQNLQPNWPQVIKLLMQDEDFGVQLKKEIPRTTDLDNALKTVTDPYQRMVIIHNYVRKNMEWNGYTSIWAMDGVKSAWKEKKGTSGEINLILVNLLKDAGLKAHPILVSTRENGRVLTTLPDISQFDKVMAHVKINNKVFVLDGTEKFTCSNIIPYDVMYSEGLVIEKIDTYEWGWETLWNDAQFKNTTILSATIDEKGQMAGTASVNSFDYSRAERTPRLKDGKDKFISHYFTSNNPGTVIDTINFENEDIDSLPLIQKFKFKQSANSSGDYTYFSANMFSGLEKNPFITDNRFSDVFFGTNQEYNIIAHFFIPEGYVFEELPKNIRMIMPDTSISITRRVAAEKNQLSTRITLQFKKPYYTPEEYADFKEFYKKLFDLLNEQFVMRKKTNS